MTTTLEAPATAARASLVGVSKTFAATQALTDVSLDLRASEVHALVGENGAGKSTLVKILAGVHQPDTGLIRLDGEDVTIPGPAQARALGIAVVHQEPRLFPDLSVAENVFIGHAPAGPLRTVDWGAMRRQAETLFEELDVRFDVQAPVRGLSMADQQLIEIAKALSVSARVLILDEPTASLSAHEVERLFAIVRGLRDRGVAILFVSHRLGEVFDLCDTATVLRDGKHVITTPTAELTTDALIRHMVGRAVTLFPKADNPIGDVLLDVQGLSRAGRVRRHHASRSGPARSWAWPGWSGRAGPRSPGSCSGSTSATPARSPSAGRSVRFASPSDAMDAGIAYLPESRHDEGLVLDFSIAQNVTLPILPRLFPRLLVKRSTEGRVAREYTEQFRVRTTGVDQLVGALSGGNQQKVVLAKWLASKPTVLILDEPTRGIDIGAKVEVHRIISDLAASGLAILLISSDLPEVLAMSDRILVLHEGRITAEIAQDQATEEARDVRGDRPGPGRPVRRRRRGRPMAEPMVAPVHAGGAPRGSIVGTIARQRELSLVLVMLVLGGFVTLSAPQFLTTANLSQVAVLASITAIAAIGQAIVVITRNIDLSVEAIIGLAAYCVAITLETHVLDGPGAILLGVALGLGLGMINGLLVTVFRVPSIVATLGTLSIFRGIDYLIAGSHQVPLAGLPRGLHRSGPGLDPGHPDLRARRARRGHRGHGRPALDPVRPAGLRGRQQPGGRGDPGHPGPRRRVRRVRPVRAAGGHRRRDVGHPVRDDQRHLGHGRRARRRRRGRRRRGEHLRRQRHGHRRRHRRVLPRASSPTP